LVVSHFEFMIEDFVSLCLCLIYVCIIPRFIDKFLNIKWGIMLLTLDAIILCLEKHIEILT